MDPFSLIVGALCGGAVAAMVVAALVWSLLDGEQP